MKKVVAFSGGRGSETFLKSWNSNRQFRLDLLVNPYDDGLSTGRIRDFIPGYLGPSDFRKNLVHYLHSDSNEVNKVFAAALETRVDSLEEGTHFLNMISTDFAFDSVRHQLNVLFIALDHFKSFEMSSEHRFNYKDCALGNLILAGLFLKNNYGFQESVTEVSSLFNSELGLFTVSNENNISLVAVTSKNEFLAKENLIVNGLYTGAVIKLGFMLSSDLNNSKFFFSGIRSKDDLAKIEESFVKPEPSLTAAQKLASADILCYLPGTQNSSLFPSYKIMRNAIHASPAKAKVLVLNLSRDHDMANWMRSDILNNALIHMGDEMNQNRSVTHILLNSPSDDSTLLDGPILDYCTKYDIHLIAKQTADRSAPAIHSGSVIVETLLELF